MSHRSSVFSQQLIVDDRRYFIKGNLLSEDCRLITADFSCIKTEHYLYRNRTDSYIAYNYYTVNHLHCFPACN